MMQRGEETVAIPTESSVVVVHADGTADIYLPDRAPTGIGPWVVAALAMMLNDREYVRKLAEKAKVKLGGVKP